MQDKPDDKTESQPAPRKTPANQIPAGPHARPDLTDYEKTPGTGSLPDDTSGGEDVGPD